VQTSRPFNNNLTIISLGTGCAIRTELIRKYFPEQPTLFFDYLGNFDGLESCTQIILNDFQDFQEMEDLVLFPHPKWNRDCEQKPISLCVNPPGTFQNVLVGKHFPDIIFYHYPHTTDTLQSFKRKSERLQKLLRETKRQTVFIYYRQYNEPVGGRYAEKKDYSIQEKLAKLESEAIRFRDAIDTKYPALPFTLIALIMEPFSFHEYVTPAIDEFLRQKALSPDLSSQKIIYDRVLSSVPEDTRKISSKSWGRIYRKHLVTSPLTRMTRACITLPGKWAKKLQQLRKKIKRGS
jgi:hypothetical protein